MEPNLIDVQNAFIILGNRVIIFIICCIGIIISYALIKGLTFLFGRLIK